MTSSRTDLDEPLGGYAAVRVRTPRTRSETVGRIEGWCRGADRRLIVTGKTNFSRLWLGLTASRDSRHAIQGGAGGRAPLSRLGLESLYVSGFAGHPVRRSSRAGEPSACRPGGAEGRSDERRTVTATPWPGHRPHRPTAYVATRCSSSWAACSRRTERGSGPPLGPRRTGATRCSSSCGAAPGGRIEPLCRLACARSGLRGVLSFRHDVHGMLDFTSRLSDRDLIPASYDIEDRLLEPHQEAMAGMVARTTQPQLHQARPAQRQLHRRSADRHPGTGSTSTCATRGEPGLRRPHRRPHAGGTCTPRRSTPWTICKARRANPRPVHVCYYHMIEYGVQNRT